MDYVDNGIYYGCSQYGSCIRRYDGPAVPAPVTNANFGATTGSTRRNWLTPVVLDPNDPAIVYYGGNALHKSTNRASTFTRISPPDGRPDRHVRVARPRRPVLSQLRHDHDDLRREDGAGHDLPRHRHRPPLEDRGRRR